MSDGFLEALRILALMVLVWFGLVGWKLVHFGGAPKSSTVTPNLGER